MTLPISVILATATTPRGIMIKVFLLLVAIHGVLCAPGVPFVAYGPPAESNLAEQSLPSEKLESLSSPALENLPGTRNLAEQSQLPLNLPGTRNLAEHSQLPLDLPGTRNLAEKSIPDSVTLKRIPIPLTELEVPRYAYDGRFLAGGEQREIESSPVEKAPETEQGYSQEYPPETAVYANPTPDEETGSEIKETEFSPSSNRPQTALQPPFETPDESNSGTDIQNIIVQPAPQPNGNSGADDHINIPPATSIKIQDNRGQYSHGFENPDGTQIEESGHLISTDNGWEYVIAKEGSYRYISPEGIPISVRYIADENGFRILSQNFAGR